MTSHFQYEPLEEGQIRLLRFYSKKEPDDGVLRFKLSHAKLSQRPQYAALSYSWGLSRGETPVTTIVSDQRFEVSPNLAAALDKLQQNGISTIWVDAICIDQGNPIEKSKEVTRMFAIYRIAKEVVVWLGPDAGAIEDTIQLHKMVEHTSNPAANKDKQVTPPISALDGLARLLKQPYWTRVWIIQEIAAARRTRIFWGSYSFELRPLETLVRDHYQEIEEGTGKPTLAQQVLSVRAACRAQQKPRLMEILELTSASETSVLRDKVYGLLGLASDWQDFVQEPNYAETVSEQDLCLEMTANYINWYASVDIIFLRSISQHQDALPSWCPDYFHFKVDSFDKNLVPYICGKDANLGWEKRRAFGASARMNQDIPDSFEFNGKKLTLKGVREGYISALGSILHEEATSVDDIKTSITLERSPSDIIAKAFRRLLLLSHNQTFGHLGGMHFFNLLYAIPDEYYRQTGFIPIREWLERHRAFFARFGLTLEPEAGAEAHVDAQPSMRVRSSGLLDETRIPAAWKEYASSGESSSSRRRGGISFQPVLASIASVLDEGLRLMCIGDEILLGWAHRNAQIGDSIWHLEGCTLPAILRKSPTLSEAHGEDIYQLVGHAYVDPVMASGRWLAREDKGRVVHLL